MTQTAKRITAKDPVEKFAHQRLATLQLAEALGNVSAACRRGNIDRTSFYEWKRRFQTHGFEGLKDMPPVHKYHPQTTPQEVVDKIMGASTDHPCWGCVKLSDWLKLQGISVSSPTIQNILAKHNLGARYERLLKLEERHLNEGVVLTPEEVAQIEKTNPCFRERLWSRPVPVNCSVRTLFTWVLSGCRSCLSAGRAAILHNDVLPFYRERNLSVGL